MLSLEAVRHAGGFCRAEYCNVVQAFDSRDHAFFERNRIGAAEALICPGGSTSMYSLDLPEVDTKSWLN